MTHIEISPAIAAAYATYCATNFHNMSPRMIAAEMRGSGICRVLDALNRIEADMRDRNPRGGRFLESQLRNIDALRQRAQAVWSHYDREIERSVRRAA